MSRVMALDVGKISLGVAVSDALGICAQPITTLKRSSFRKDLTAIAELIREHEVASIVIGLPLRLAGDAGPAADGAMAFAERLREAFELPVVTWDERLTTVQAERALLEGDVSRRRRKQVINQIAAAIILQSYLDSRSA
ncbi:MAG TPA: Holliday junction resolvase RuvX [Patescibacteria group bacterium]|nr:Holliday junction resolvase RuvX [Patescibacteria group bacterium]